MSDSSLFTKRNFASMPHNRLVLRLKMLLKEAYRSYRNQTVGVSDRNDIASMKDLAHELRPVFWRVILFCAFVNILMLTGPLYMLQIYDRVLTSHSYETLIAFTVLVVILYGFMALIERTRKGVATRLGVIIQQRLNERVGRMVVGRSVHVTAPKDLDALQRLCSSPVLFAVCDLPWAPFFVLIIFWLHPWLGALALISAIMLILLALRTHTVSKEPEAEMNHIQQQADSWLRELHMYAREVRAMSMEDAGIDRWLKIRESVIPTQVAFGDKTGIIQSVSKSLRLLVQSLMLGLGAYLALQQEISPGVMIVGSILLGRALAPVEQTIGGWSLVERAHRGWGRLDDVLAAQQEANQVETPLKRPVGNLSFSKLVVASPTSQDPILNLMQIPVTDKKTIDCVRVEPGQALGVIGPNGSGKSTLLELLVGASELSFRGSIEIDGASFDQYGKARGAYVGYLPQQPGLFSGTIAQNIARLSEQPDQDAVFAAAKAAGVSELIKQIGGYDKTLREVRLSGGQLQRIALARALYGEPPVLVLDEPNANLDTAGEQALSATIEARKQAGCAVVIAAHRPAAIQLCDHILILQNGRPLLYGPRADVLERVQQKQ